MLSQLATSPVRPEVDAADAQIISGADESRLQFQGPSVGFHRLLTAVAIGQRGTQAVPEQVVLVTSPSLLKQQSRNKVKHIPLQCRISITAPLKCAWIRSVLGAVFRRNTTFECSFKDADPEFRHNQWLCINSGSAP